VVGWPPVRRRPNKVKFVKVAVAGAPYQRKVDLEAYAGYDQLLAALQDKFTAHFTVRECIAAGPCRLCLLLLLCCATIFIEHGCVQAGGRTRRWSSSTS